MKNILITIFTALALTSTAQTAINVTASADSTVDSKKYYSVDIPQVKLKDVANDWQQYTSKGNKGKSSYTNGTYMQTAAVNTNISPYPFTLYSMLTETTAGVRVTLWLPDTRASINNNQDLAVKKYLHDFAVTAYRKVVETELKTEQNKLNDLERDMSRIITGDEKSNKTINTNERSNQRSEDAIVTNNSDIKASDKKISDQKDMVDYTAPDANATKGAQKTLDQMEKDKADLQKQNEAQNKHIDSRDKESRAADRNMETGQQNMQLKTATIEKQKEVVRAVQAKLNGIR
jgi:hypothetical protein